MDLVKLHGALDEANTGLAEVSERFEALRLEKAKLESVVSSIRALLGQDDTLPKPFTATAETVTRGEEGPKNGIPPLWELARGVLRERMTPMSVPQIAERLLARGLPVRGDGIRVAMLRKPEIFNNPRYGFYALKEWEGEPEQLDIMAKPPVTHPQHQQQTPP